MINGMVRGVTFGNKHSFWDFGLVTASAPVVSAPAPKLKLVEVPGADGLLDLSESLTGQVQYGPRTISCQYMLMGNLTTQERLYQGVLNALHGKRMDIILDDDDEYTYTGRVQVTGYKPRHGGAGELTITATVNPYKTPRFYDGEAVL